MPKKHAQIAPLRISDVEAAAHENGFDFVDAEPARRPGQSTITLGGYTLEGEPIAAAAAVVGKLNVQCSAMRRFDCSHGPAVIVECEGEVCDDEPVEPTQEPGE